MLKRVLACFCSFLIVISFCCQCFVVSAATEGSSGGGGHRGDYLELNRAPIDTELTEAQINANFLDDFRNNLGESMSDFFYYCLGTAGAVFSDDTTIKSVRNQYNAIYANALSSPEEMRKIFYYGTDGQLYFTDEFLKNFRSIVDENSFNQGVFSIPYATNESFYQSALSIGCLAITNSITSCLNGDDSRLMIQYGNFFNTGFSTAGLYPVFPFSSFSDYRNFCDTSVSSSSLNIYLYSSSTSKVSSEPIYPWSKTPSGGSFSTASTGDSRYATFFSNSGNGLDYFTVYKYPREPGYPRYTAYAGFVGLGAFEAYRSVDHMQYYLSGGTGVIRGNTYYALDNAQNLDDIMGKDWKTYYQGLQKQYKELAGEVAAGNKTLKEINQTLSDQILDTVADISKDVAQQTNYLKKILEEIRSISGKLTYSNVVGTVSAASNLLSAICDGLDSLFGGEDSGVFSLLDFVENHVLNESGQTAASIMKSVFPFSLPQDFYLILELLSVDPQTPQVHFKFELKRLNMSYDYTYVADDFAKLAYMTRFFSSVGFVLLLINFTNKILKK
ncbi:hypothetical protein [Ruminococcus sp.]